MLLKISLTFIFVIIIVILYWRSEDYFYYLFQRDLEEEKEFEPIDPLIYKEMQYLTNQKFLSIISRDGIELNARFINNYNKTFVILLHDYRSSTESLYEHGKIFYDKGYNVIFPALRGHRGSDGEFCGLGWLDSYDLLDWISYLKNSFSPDINIILFGQGVGANAIIFALEDIDASIPIILESPYSKFNNIIKRFIPIIFRPLVQLKIKNLFNIPLNLQTKDYLCNKKQKILLIYNKHIHISSKDELTEQKQYLSNGIYFEDLSNLNMINSQYLEVLQSFINDNDPSL